MALLASSEYAESSEHRTVSSGQPHVRSTRPPAVLWHAYSLFRNKAVSEGAVSFFLTKVVRARIARVTYGVTQNVHYKSDNPEHTKRKHKMYHNPSGDPMLPGGYRVFIAKVEYILWSDDATKLTGVQGTRLEEDTVIRHSYYRESKNRSELDSFISTFKAYRGAQKSPSWIDEDPSTSCIIIPKYWTGS